MRKTEEREGTSYLTSTSDRTKTPRAGRIYERRAKSRSLHVETRAMRVNCRNNYLICTNAQLNPSQAMRWFVIVFEVVCCILHFLTPFNTRLSSLVSMYSRKAAPFNKAFQFHRHSGIGVVVKLLQDSFRLLVLHLDLHHGRLDFLQ